MKKTSKYLPPNGGTLNLRMKFILFFILAAYINVDASTYAQDTRLSVNLNNASVNEVLEALEQQSEFTFMYRSNLFATVDKQNVDIENVTVYQYLDDYLVPEGFEYEVEDKTVIIRNAANISLAQQENNVTVTGIVKDDTGATLPGVAIQIKGTTTGTITDIDGKYTISNLSGDEVLVISFVGMQTQEISISGKTKIDVTLSPDAVGLEEVIAVGYGVKKKSVVTGSISSVSSEDLVQSKPSNINSALNGRAAGVIVSPVSGQPGASPQVNIRGVGTNGNSNPLYIIDGLPMSDMNAVNPNDIESMEVLKDATSAAIYGARAANGVILITTKKGKAGQSTLTYDGFYGVQNAYHVPDMMNSDQYINMVKQFHDNDNPDQVGAYPDWIQSLDPSINTNWFDEVTEPAKVTEHNITATFGSDKGSTLLSIGYRDQDGIIGGDNSYFKRYSARVNTTHNVKEWLTVGANMNVQHIDKASISMGVNGYNTAGYAFMMDPTTPPHAGPGTAFPDYPNYDERGYGVTASNATRMWNPLHFMEVQDGNRENKTDRLYGNTYLQIEPIKNLIIKTDFAANISNNSNKKYTPAYNHRPSQVNNFNEISQNSSRNTFWQWENTITYSHSFGDHNLSGLLGTTASENTYAQMGGSRQKLPGFEAENNPNWWYLDAGDVATATNTGKANAMHALASIFGRVSYDYRNKYMAEVVVRRDGSTNFGPNNRYAVFPGVSAGWNISNEDFWDLANFDVLKVRASWGQNGNEAIDPFSYTSIISNDYFYMLGTNTTILPGSAPQNLINENVRWETSEQFNVGVDMVFYGGKLRGNIDYYTKNTKDLLLTPIMEDIRGNDIPYYNIGEVSNKGLEFQVTYRTKIGEVDFGVSANASYLKNEVVAVGNENGFIDGGQWRTNAEYTTRMEVGKPMGYFYGYKTLGVFQNQQEIDNYKYSDGTLIQPNAKPGDLIYKDTDGEGGITDNDRTDIGNPWPKWTYGLNLNAGWKGIDFSMFITGKADLDVMACHYRSELYGDVNLPTFYNDAWQKEGDNTNFPRLANGNFQKPSDIFMYDASYLKIGTLELGYTLPKAWTDQVKLSNVRFSVAMDNVAIFTKYPFFDPEVGAMEDDVLTTGLDRSIYPQARTTRVGLTVNF
ncbi:SusC/RagA family TonB-linked outer membrane protein [Saccharicrinis aurantiacus]|uniref:SusC/RagA family TonB-linked outer membrane protein n=1 Tax=Saccharicrinis aurantiacus TaxID=1849719 RepID=UPI002492FED1|nr:TonB-dependent receptor [Saccharicrinis aurantiacus]